MPIGIGDLIVVHSGGAVQDDLGGAISTEPTKRVVSQNTTRSTTNISGTTIDDAFGNPEGVGSLFYNDAATELGWKAYGQSTYYGVNVSSPGTYVIGSSSGYLIVTVTSIPSGSDLFDNVTVANNQNNVFGPVSSADSLLGIEEYRCLYVQNSSGTFTATNVKMWILENTPAEDDIYIGLDPAGLNGEATSTTGLSVPAGVTFSQPSSQGGGLVIGTLLPGEYFAFWQRRTVPPETRGTVISNGAQIAISLDV